MLTPKIPMLKKNTLFTSAVVLSQHPALVQTASFVTKKLTEKGNAENVKSYPTSNNETQITRVHFRRAALLPRMLDTFFCSGKEVWVVDLSEGSQLGRLI